MIGVKGRLREDEDENGDGVDQGGRYQCGGLVSY